MNDYKKLTPREYKKNNSSPKTIDELEIQKRKWNDNKLLTIEECSICEKKFGKYFGSYLRDLETGKKRDYNAYSLCGKKECWEIFNQEYERERERERIGECDECEQTNCPQIFHVKHHWRTSIGNGVKTFYQVSQLCSECYKERKDKRIK